MIGGRGDDMALGGSGLDGRLALLGSNNSALDMLVSPSDQLSLSDVWRSGGTLVNHDTFLDTVL